MENLLGSIDESIVPNILEVIEHFIPVDFIFTNKPETDEEIIINKLWKYLLMCANESKSRLFRLVSLKCIKKNFNRRINLLSKKISKDKIVPHEAQEFKDNWLHIKKLAVQVENVLDRKFNDQELLAEFNELLTLLKKIQALDDLKSFGVVFGVSNYSLRYGKVNDAPYGDSWALLIKRFSDNKVPHIEDFDDTILGESVVKELEMAIPTFEYSIEKAQGFKAMFSEDYDRAARLLEAHIRNNPTEISGIYVRLAVAYVETEQWDKVIGLGEKDAGALQLLTTEQPRFNFAVAKAYMKQGGHESFRKWLPLASEFNSKEWFEICCYANELRNMMALKESRQYYLTALKGAMNADDDNTIIFIRKELAKIMAVYDHEEAIRALETLVSDFMGRDDVHYDLAIILMSANDLNRAIKQFEIAVDCADRNENKSFILTMMAECYLKLNDKVNAQGMLERALNLNPQNVDALYRIGLLFIDIGGSVLIKQARTCLGLALDIATKPELIRAIIKKLGGLDGYEHDSDEANKQGKSKMPLCVSSVLVGISAAENMFGVDIPLLLSSHPKAVNWIIFALIISAGMVAVIWVNRKTRTRDVVLNLASNVPSRSLTPKALASKQIVPNIFIPNVSVRSTGPINRDNLYKSFRVDLRFVSKKPTTLKINYWDSPLYPFLNKKGMNLEEPCIV